MFNPNYGISDEAFAKVMREATLEVIARERVREQKKPRPFYDNLIEENEEARELATRRREALAELPLDEETQKHNWEMLHHQIEKDIRLDWQEEKRNGVDNLAPSVESAHLKAANDLNRWYENVRNGGDPHAEDTAQPVTGQKSQDNWWLHS
jgi:hypothetical protein